MSELVDGLSHIAESIVNRGKGSPEPPQSPKPARQPEEPLKLSRLEIKEQQEAHQLINLVKDKFAEFEFKLTASDIDFIIQPNPDALARRTHSLHVAGDCTKEQYAAIRENLGAKRLSEIGEELVLGASNYEMAYRDKYQKRERKLLLNDERFRDYRDLL